MTGSILYKDAMSYYEANDEDGGALQHLVWDETPWMLNINEGKTHSGIDLQMIKWCDHKWGQQFYWPTGRTGSWQRGSATVNGWTWWGFDTEEKKNEFYAK